MTCFVRRKSQERIPARYALLRSHTSDHEPCGSGGVSLSMLGHVHDSPTDSENQLSLVIASLPLKVQKQAEHKSAISA